ncbi:MAG: permease-like cell division protein FtsX [Patescibacteria group bacterium]
MITTAIRRIIRSGFIGFWRNAYVSLASIFTLTVALFVIGSTMFIDQLLTTSMTTLQAKVDINVYFVPEAPQEEIDRLYSAVKAMPEVEFVHYTSREDALTDYRSENQNNEIAMQALESLDDNPLGANLAIQATDPIHYEKISKFFEEQKGNESPQTPVIDKVSYLDNKDAIDTLSSIINAIEKASFVVMSVLLIAAVLITFNTIRLAIYTAREEISIMRLVGASNMFIRGPFMLQGTMYGLLAGLLAVISFYPIMLWLGPRTEEFFEFNLLTYYLENIFYIFFVLAGIGIVLGLVSSILAVARYLRT